MVSMILSMSAISPSGELAGDLALQVHRVEQQPRQRVLDLVRDLRGGAAEGGDLLLMREPLVRLDQLGRALGDARFQLLGVLA